MRQSLPVLFLCSLSLLSLSGSAQHRPLSQSERDTSNRQFITEAWHASPARIRELLAAGARIEGTDEDGRRALMLAAINGQVETVKTLLACGAKVDARDGWGRTALFYAATAPQHAVETTTVLLRAGAHINAASKYGETPLKSALEDSRLPFERRSRPNEEQRAIAAFLKQHGAHVGLAEAAFSGDVERFHALLRAGADIHAPAVTSALETAIRQRDISIVRLLLDAGADPSARDREGMSLLMQAVGEGRFDIIQALVTAGADVNSEDQNGVNALLMAHGPDREAILQLLLERGVNVNARSRSGTTLLMRFAEGAFREDVERGGNTIRPAHRRTELFSTNGLLSDYFYPTTNEAEDAATIRMLVSRGADVNARDRDGVTALMYAAMMGQKLITKTLIACGADVNMRDRVGETALTLAPLNSLGQTVAPELLEAGARMDLVNALTLDDFPTARAILAQGGDIRTRDCFAQTPLMLAAIKGQTDMVETLLERGADVNARAGDGRTPLMLAIQNRLSLADLDHAHISYTQYDEARTKIVALLLSHHADPNLHTNFRKGLPARLKGQRAEETALSIAQKVGNQPVIDLLLRYGAKPGCLLARLNNLLIFYCGICGTLSQSAHRLS